MPTDDAAPIGRPVHLTNGERKLLVRLVEAEIARLGTPPIVPGDVSPAKQAAHVGRLRLRQYVRLIHELRQARPEPIPG